MDANTIRRHVTNCVDRLCTDFGTCPNSLLTEDDMRVRLGALLLEHFGTHQRTEDGDSSIPLHSEVRWYGNGRLKYRSDLVVIDVGTLRVRNVGGLQLPSKGYGFNVPKAIIELKFRRPTGESDRAFIESIEADCAKLRTIRSQLSEETPRLACWVVAFDKKGDVTTRVPTGHGATVVYKSSGSAEDTHRPEQPVSIPPELRRDDGRN